MPNDLRRHAAALRRLRPARAFVNRGQRQKPPGLRPILRPPCGGPHHPRIKISPKWNWHGEPPALATLNQTHADSGISPSESRLLSFGIIPRLVDQDPWAQLRRPMDMIRQG